MPRIITLIEKNIIKKITNKMKIIKFLWNLINEIYIQKKYLEGITNYSYSRSFILWYIESFRDSQAAKRKK